MTCISSLIIDQVVIILDTLITEIIKMLLFVIVFVNLVFEENRVSISLFFLSAVYLWLESEMFSTALAKKNLMQSFVWACNANG